MKCEESTSTGKKGMSDSELTEKTKVPLGLVIATIISFIAGALWINNSLNEIRNELTLIKIGVNSTLSARDMELWILRLRHDNPTLKVPDLTK